MPLHMFVCVCEREREQEREMFTLPSYTLFSLSLWKKKSSRVILNYSFEEQRGGGYSSECLSNRTRALLNIERFYVQCFCLWNLQMVNFSRKFLIWKWGSFSSSVFVLKRSSSQKVSVVLLLSSSSLSWALFFVFSVFLCSSFFSVSFTFSFLMYF